MAIKRREFLGHMAAGSAILTVPAFLNGCAVPTSGIAAFSDFDKIAKPLILDNLP